MKITKYSITILLIIILVIVSIIILVMPGKTYKADTYETIDLEYLDKFSNNNSLEQSFVSKDNYSYIGFPIATYNTLIKEGILKVSIINESGKEKKYSVNVDSVLDAQDHYFKYNLKKNKKYTIIVTSENLSSPVTFAVTNADIKNTKLVVDGKQINKTLVLSFMKSKKNYFSIWYCLLIISVLSSYAILIKENK